MRMLPFFKPKKGFMIAGGGLDTGGGGGGGSTYNFNFSYDSEIDTGMIAPNGKKIYAKAFTSTVSATSCTFEGAMNGVDRIYSVLGSGSYTDFGTKVKYGITSWRVNNTSLIVYIGAFSGNVIYDCVVFYTKID